MDLYFRNPEMIPPEKGQEILIKIRRSTDLFDSQEAAPHAYLYISQIYDGKDYVVNKETGNKIYNEEYENLDSKALSQQEKLDIISVNKLKGKKGKKNRKLR